MSESEVIKQFLIALGFKIDERSFRKFDDATGLSTKSVGALGLSVVAAGVAVEAFAIKVAKSFDALYFASKRTGSSAQEINAFGFAVSQMGGNADDAKSSLENLARFMRTQPGASGFLTKTLGVKPEDLKNMVKVMNDLAAKFQTMPMYLAYRYAGMLGIDEKTTQAMLDKGTLYGKEDDYSRQVRAAGLDPDKLAESSKDFINQLKILESSFGMLAATMETHLLPVVIQLNDFILRLAGWTSGGADDVGERPPLIGGTKEQWDKFNHRHDNEGSGDGQIPAFLGGPIGIRNNNPGNLRSWGNMPKAGGFATFPNAAAGLTAMAKQLNRYGSRGTDTIAGIVNRWAPSLDGNNVAAYINDMMKQTGFGAAQHLNMNDPGTLGKLMNGIISHENGRNPYSAPLISAAARAGAQATLNQKTEIKIMGGDAHGTANAIAAEQGRVNSNAVRNLVGAVQ